MLGMEMYWFFIVGNIFFYKILYYNISQNCIIFEKNCKIQKNVRLKKNNNFTYKYIMLKSNRKPVFF